MDLLELLGMLEMKNIIVSTNITINIQVNLCQNKGDIMMMILCNIFILFVKFT